MEFTRVISRVLCHHAYPSSAYCILDGSTLHLRRDSSRHRCVSAEPPCKKYPLSAFANTKRKGGRKPISGAATPCPPCATPSGCCSYHFKVILQAGVHQDKNYRMLCCAAPFLFPCIAIDSIIGCTLSSDIRYTPKVIHST